MRHVKTACGLAAAMCAFGVAAVPALASGPEFVASINGQTISPTTPAFTKGRFAPEVPKSGETTQEFKFGEFLIKCEKVVSKGEITVPVSPTFRTTLKFAGCGYYPKPSSLLHFSASFSTSGITLEYHRNGFAEIEGNGEGEIEPYGSKVTLLETAALVKIPNAKYCTIILPEQTVPAKAIKHPEEEFSAALYSEESVPAPGKKFLFPEGEQKKLLVTNEFKGLKYKFASESQCGEDLSKTEGSTGVFKGNILEEVIKGNLTLEEV